MTIQNRPFVLALDCGTTGNRAIVFDSKQRIIANAYREFTQHYPHPGWVEHDAEEIWDSVRGVLRQVLTRVPVRKIRAIGITNQRETVVVWDRKTGRPAHRAIVWQCRRSSGICAEMRKKGLERQLHRTTGLFLDPYFSASKILWLSRQSPRIRKGLRSGRTVCGTIDSWVLWNLTGGSSFSTDPTNASRTMLYDIRKGRWDSGLCRLFGMPLGGLPEVLPSGGVRAVTKKALLGESIPVAGVAGDQQAAAFAQGCSVRGVVKNTYGTGLFVVAETGKRPRFSRRLVTTIAATESTGRHYALEGSIFIGGAAMQWLRDGLGILESAAASEAIARGLTSNDGVYFVPALAGLGCPHWDPHARGIVIGLTRRTTAAHIVRAGLESIAFQTRDVLEIMRKEARLSFRRLRVDGGAVKNNFLMQFQADMIGCEVERPSVVETTALGAAGLAGIATGLWKSKEDFLRSRKVDRIFRPRLSRTKRDALYAVWKRAVERSKNWANNA